MKKLIIIFLASILAAAVQLNAQNPASYIYCELLGHAKFFSNKVKITIDYGQDTKFGEDARIRNEHGEVMTFNSMVDAMNWLGQKGWEFCQAYAVTEGDVNVYHWLLKLDTSNLSQEQLDYVLSIFKTKRDFKIPETPQTDLQ
jgi:hypothetical protein